jgi:signal transduction histidine kinase/CheY-like chemotaxis protein
VDSVAEERKYRILIVDDEKEARLVLRMMVERSGYQVIEAKDGEEALLLYDEAQPDVVLMDVMMPHLDGFSTAQQLLEMSQYEIPIVMVTALHDEDSVEKAFRIGATDYLTKPVTISVLRHRINRLIRTKTAEENLQQIIEDQKILHRIDRELGYTLDLNRVLNLAMDSSMRRTGASACIVAWIEPSRQQLQKLASIGSIDLLAKPISLDELQNPDHPLHSAFKPNATLTEIALNDFHTRILLPLIVQNETAGVIVLENILSGYYNTSDLNFLNHLAGRTSAAIDKSRLYQYSQQHNLQMDRLNEITTALSRSFEQKEMRQMSAQGLVVLLEGTCGIFYSLDKNNHTLVVEHGFRLEETTDILPAVGSTISLKPHSALLKQLHEGPVQFQVAGENFSDELMLFVKGTGIQAGLLVPLIFEDKFIGLLLLGESRFTRYYNADEKALARSFGNHTTILLRQADLFNQIRQLEEVKSEMIRMASHDLKNPLLQVGGYLDLLVRTMTDISPEQREFINRISAGTKKMNSLLEDILNLERVESHLTTELEPVDIRRVLMEVVAGLQPQADIKSQHFVIDIAESDAVVLGNEIQLQQALTNLVGNAIKYTPLQGTVMVKCFVENDNLKFQVRDTGYGIPKDRQSRLFERFYRARTPGTEEIPGTGLGLSLVKTVIERHGGQVWFESEEGKGSTFGCTLPIKTSANIPSSAETEA